jgi:hypothetical protein
VSPTVTKIRETQTENRIGKNGKNPLESNWRRDVDSNPRYDSALQIHQFPNKSDILKHA